MAIGDDALAAGMTIVDGNTAGSAALIDDYINETRDFIAQRTAVSASITPIAKGGTGSATAAGARTNLNVPSWSDVAPAGNVFSNQIARFSSAGRLQVVGPVAPDDVATKAYTDARVTAGAGSPVQRTGDTMTGDLYLPNSSPAVSSFTVCYINGDGRVSRGSSSERYKKFISEIDPEQLGDVFPQLHRYQMRTGDGQWKYGWIAERLAENDATEPFVVYQQAPTGDGSIGPTDVPESIDFISLLQVQVAVLHQRDQDREAEVAELRAQVAELRALVAGEAS